MKKETTKVFGIISIFFLLMAKTVSAQDFAGGTGLESDPYIITNAEQLFNVRKAANAYYIIQNDIDLSAYQSGEGWLPIAGFSGRMDGRGHMIRNLKINRPSTTTQGLFAQIVPPSGEVRNLHVSGEVTGDSQVGGIAGQCFGIMSNCSFTGTVKGGNQNIGGVVGMVMTQGPVKATLTNCYNTAAVSGANKLGGIAGFSSNAAVKNCYNTGRIDQTNSIAGGIVGFNDNAEISNCYNTGQLTGKDDVGGIAGFTNPYAAKITKCYNLGNVSGNACIGGIVGRNAESQITNCVAVNVSLQGDVSAGVNRIAGKNLGGGGDFVYYLDNYALASMTINGSLTTVSDAGSINGLSKSLNELKTQSTYETNLQWNFTNDWAFIVGYFPQLRNTTQLPEDLFAGGKGTEEEPYKIANAKQLDNIRLLIDSHFILQNDIDLIDYQREEGWLPISVFSGSLDGKGYTVKNLKINRPAVDNVGLFGRVYGIAGKNAGIKNLSVSGNVIGKKYVGGLVGSIEGNIERCNFTGTLKGTDFVGGIAGDITSNSSLGESERYMISESYHKGEIISSGSAGGIVGSANYAIISRCFNTDSIRGLGGGYVGGIVGYAVGWSRGEGPYADKGGCLIKDCYNTGHIDGGFKIGGIVGSAISPKTLITHSYNIGNVTTNNQERIVGGIIGMSTDAAISGCMAGSLEVKGAKAGRIAGEISGSASLTANNALSSMLVNGEALVNKDAGTINGLDKTMSELKLKLTYENLGWDFTDTWVSVSGFFPLLKNISETPQEVFAGGSGSSEDPYIITTAMHLNNVRTALNAHFVMMADVDLSDYQEGEGWLPLGLASSGFTGNFNGKGHKITNLKINRPQKDGQSLFGYSRNAVIDSIVVENASVDGNKYAAVIVSRCENMGVRFCEVSGRVEGAEYVAGIMGYGEKCAIIKCKNGAEIKGLGYLAGISGLNEEGGISECVNTGKVEAISANSLYKYAGGITSLNNKGTVQKCGNEGSISNKTKYAGGIIGLSAEGRILECYNTGDVKGVDRVGGICATASGTYSSVKSDVCTITNSYNEGTVTGSIDVGGVIGNAWISTITGCYNKGEVVGPETMPDGVSTTTTGGVTGRHDQSVSRFCYNTGKVSGYEYVGGIAGGNTGKIMESYNDGTIKTIRDYAGGIAGTNLVYDAVDSTVVRLCYNTGTIEGGHNYSGGIVGANSGIIENNYNVGLIKGVLLNGGIAGYNRALAAAPIIRFNLNRGNVQGSDLGNGGILGVSGNLSVVTFNVAANNRVDGVESYRIIGGEVGEQPYYDNNLALETMLVNGVKITSDDPMGFDGKGVSSVSILSEDTYLALAWDFDDHWYMIDGISYPILKWQPCLSANVGGKIAVKLNETFEFTLELDKKKFDINPQTDIVWDYEKDKGITISSMDNLSFKVTGNKLANTTLSIELKSGNSLRIPVEIIDGSGIKQHQTSDEVKVYPNPVLKSGELTIDLGDPDQLIESVCVYDLSSRVIMTANSVANSRISLPVGNLASGTYILTILTGSGDRISKNIVVE